MVLAALAEAALAAVELEEAGSRADLRFEVKLKKNIIQLKRPIQIIFESAFLYKQPFPKL